MDKFINTAKVLALKELTSIRPSEIRTLWLEVKNNKKVFWQRVESQLTDFQLAKFQRLVEMYTGLQGQIDNSYTKIISFQSTNYPVSLDCITDFPLTLSLKGNHNLLNNPDIYWLAVVGTRNCSHSARVILKDIMKKLAGFNIGVISGMAFGIDKLAHELAIEHQLPTIAVLPGGLNQILPTRNKDIYQSILDNSGLVVTEEFEPQKVTKYIYPKRNRIVAGLCRSLLIAQAPAKSGALISADLAFNYGRDVLALPGEINSDLYIGNNKLIAENIAKCVYSSDQLIRDLGFSKVESSKNRKVTLAKMTNKQLTEVHMLILELVKNGIQELDKICVKIDRSKQEVIGLVAELELMGIINQNIFNNTIEINE